MTLIKKETSQILKEEIPLKLAEKDTGKYEYSKMSLRVLPLFEQDYLGLF